MAGLTPHVCDGFGVPADKRGGATQYDTAGLESLIGVLSTTDSQRLRKAGKAAGGRGDSPDTDLVQRASAEEWRLRREVCAPAHIVVGVPVADCRLPFVRRAGVGDARIYRVRAVCGSVQDTMAGHVRGGEGAQRSKRLP